VETQHEELRDELVAILGAGRELTGDTDRQLADAFVHFLEHRQDPETKVRVVAELPHQPHYSLMAAGGAWGTGLMFLFLLLLLDHPQPSTFLLATIVILAVVAALTHAMRPTHAAAATVDAGVLVSLGGDIATAGEAPEGGWIVQVGEDSRAPISAGEEKIRITSGAIATSSTTVRRWVRGEALIHHILDPRTGLPAVGRWRTASTVARTCVDANLAATAAIVKGEEAVAWLEGARIPARLVAQDGAIHRVAGWPEASR